MIYPYKGKTPKIADSTFIADYVTVIGDVTIGEGCSVWFNTAVRGDLEAITIGNGSNVQENSSLHTSTGYPLTIADNVTVGHGCVLHGATICEGALIGMGSTILDGSEIGAGALVGAGSLVPPGKKIPPNVLAVGNPIKVIRELTEKDKLHIRLGNEDYQEKAVIYKAMQVD